MFGGGLGTIIGSVGGAVLGGPAGSTVGGALGSQADSYADAGRVNQMNKDAAQKQMDFQERMSSTAYQRAMQDAKKAGLNPMLVINQGGASSPSGAMSVAQQNQHTGNLVNSAVKAVALRKEFEQADSQINLNNQNANRYKAETELTNTSAQNARIQQQIMNENLSLIKKANAVEKKRLQYSDKYMDFDQNTQRINQGLETGSQLINAASGVLKLRTSPFKKVKGGVVNKKTGEYFD